MKKIQRIAAALLSVLLLAGCAAPAGDGGEDGRVKVEPFITHHFPLKDMEKAYEVYQSKQCIKIILNP